jgi:dihydroorotase-like cyclic amidohydrolase
MTHVMDLIIRNGRVRGGKEPVDIAVEGEKITAVAANYPGRA